jgi:hypothetical protein
MLLPLPFARLLFCAEIEGRARLRGCFSALKSKDAPACRARRFQHETTFSCAFWAWMQSRLSSWQLSPSETPA